MAIVFFFRRLRCVPFLMAMSLLVCVQAGYARSGFRPPSGCKPANVRYDDNRMYFTPVKKQSVFFIYNQARSPVKLVSVVPKDEPFAVVVALVLNPRYWASLTVDQPHHEPILTLRCEAFSHGRVVGLVACKHAIRVCEYRKTKFPDHINGTHFIARHPNLNLVRKVTIKEGFLLR
jgi:hypothetical protein